MVQAVRVITGPVVPEELQVAMVDLRMELGMKPALTEAQSSIQVAT